MSSRQTTIPQARDDAPTTGVDLDERTHYAHVRYAATETPGVIWFDPRDGHERLSLNVDTSQSALEVEDSVVTSIVLHGKRSRCGVVDPDTEWMLVTNTAGLREYPVVGLSDETIIRVVTYRDAECFDSQQAARDAARERFPEYRAAPYRDAVEHRTEVSR